MKTLEDLTRYFDATMRPKLEVLEAERRRYRPQIWRWLRWLLGGWALIVVVAVARGLDAEQVYEELLPAHVAFFFAVFIVTGWRLVRYVLRVEPILRRCKDEVIVPMVRWLVPELAYQPEASVDLELAERSHLLRPHDRLEGEDYFQGRLGQTDLEFGELVVHYHTTERGRNGKVQTKHHEERGLFLVASGNKPLTGETRIYPDLLEGLIGDSAAQMLTARHLPTPPSQDSRPDASASDAAADPAADPTDLHLIHMEDVAFEKLFRVYCTDDVEAHYILTPSLMARLTRYREKAGRDVRMCFKDSRLYAYFPPEPGQAYALFDVGGFQDLLDFGNFRLMHDELAMVVGIVEDLNLNLRIWGPPQPAQG